MKNTSLAILFCLLANYSYSANYKPSGIQFNIENDLFAKGRSDRWYTNGFRLSWTFQEAPTNWLSESAQNLSKYTLWQNENSTLTYTLGQSMYTPQDITIPTPQLYDRPWGAFLFFGATSHAYKGRVFAATDIKIGTTGSSALGEQAQSNVHDAVGANDPLGWDNQLNHKLGFQLSHARVYRIGDTQQGDRFSFQGNVGFNIGTLRRYAQVGGSLLIGDLDGKDTPILIGNEGDFVAQDYNNREQFRRLFGYISVSMTGVAYNYFLEGDTPYGKSDIDAKNHYITLQYGISIPAYKKSKYFPRIIYAQSRRTAEFTSPNTHKDSKSQRWGTITFNWDMN
ncbi:lipid A deacylase LpxR family protein [Agitococcus lubricus]|uniref:Uncharacterized protein DUF2219 n=1 Tax=Agitococcus lubricus TaxID=1077255 RepID=A0A2T5J2W5_9GAMM|nr:lipid A deacylase LpxR family protein [Agitococcus lubricus]PTQ90947.1 uncharacterized protein DUF2219 [Agitococcus lubricus]